MQDGSHKCPSCGHVMPLPPNTPMTWCPCSWREDKSGVAKEKPMKKLVALTVALAVLSLAGTAHADRGGVPHKNAPAAPVLSFSCDGTWCVYAVSPGPLEPLTAYDTSVQFSGTGGGCNVGTGGWRTDASGAFVQVLSESAIKCGRAGAGTVTVWARAAGSAWDASAVPGTSVTVLIG